jgi:hypothetical protein
LISRDYLSFRRATGNITGHFDGKPNQRDRGGMASPSFVADHLHENQEMPDSESGISSLDLSLSLSRINPINAFIMSTTSIPCMVASPEAAPGAGQTAGSREYLTFCLGREEYGIDILSVQEIRGYSEPTRMANTPSFIKGGDAERMLILLDIDELMSSAEMGLVAQTLQ